MEPAGRFDDQVDFVTSALPPEKQGRRPSMVQIGFGCLGNHMIFKKGSPKGVGGYLGRFPDTKQVAQQTGVVKVELGTFNHPLVEVAG